MSNFVERVHRKWLVYRRFHAGRSNRHSGCYETSPGRAIVEKALDIGGRHMASESVAATGTVNSVDAAEKKVNITHEPIPALDWPGMTMDFPLGDEVSLEGIESGTKVTFHIRKVASGAYVIESLSALGK